jgi:formamidase
VDGVLRAQWSVVMIAPDQQLSVISWEVSSPVSETWVKIPADKAHNRWYPDLSPVARLQPGETVTLETRDGIDGQLGPESTHDDVGRVDLGLGHPLTGPLWIEGAKPGDLLEVEFVEYETAEFGFTAIIPGFGFLADLFPEPYVLKWEIKDGLARSPDLPGVGVPGEPFAGVIGVAPSHELMSVFRRREELIAAAGGPVAPDLPEMAQPQTARSGLRTIPPRETGGNLDTRGLVAGARIVIPVSVPGALLSIGDLHFAQGDGEVCGSGIEVAGAVTICVRIRHSNNGWHPEFPAYETPMRPSRAYVATTGIPTTAALDLTAAARAALLEMIRYLQATYGFSRPAAYALCSACVDLHLSQVVDVPYPLVSALLPSDIFESGPD